MPDPFREPGRPLLPIGAARGGRWRTALATALLAAGPAAFPALAQIRVEVRAPIEIGGTIHGESRGDADPGPRVQMLESPNIDRFLRKAQDFLSRENYPSAVKLLQEVIEGRTLVEGEAGTADPGAEKPQPTPTDDPWVDLVTDARHAVFSQDGRLFRPVRLLCHELLASMPPAGIAFYRAQFEVPAERALEQAIADGGIQPLQQVFERWFVTRAAARAMLVAGDRMLDRGRVREAVRTLRLLLDVWPAADREAAGIDPRYVRVKIALALEVAGDPIAARAELQALGAERPDASLRIGGELTAVADLAARGFGVAAVVDRIQPARSSAVRLLASEDEQLVPVWEFRFTDPDPYRRARSNETGRGPVVIMRGEGAAPTPPVQQFRSGPVVTFADDRVAFDDHFRVTAVELTTGRLRAVGVGTARIPDPITGQPRLRIPAYDFGALRVVIHDGRHFTVVGPDSIRLGGMETVLRNDLEAWSEDGRTRLWHAREHAAFDQTTWLAAPTPLGPWLLAPTWRKDTLELTCVDAATGELIYRTPLHRGGSAYTRPIGTPVVVDNGTAFVVTQAGALAAVDARTGSLRWLRRYERIHPLRERVASRTRPRANDPFGRAVFQELPVEGFAPSDTLVVDGLVIFGATDSQVLHCLDGASGEPRWMISRRGDLLHPIGHDGDFLYVVGRDVLMCVGLRSGVRLWSATIPAHLSNSAWRGRPTLWNGLALVPGDDRLLARPLRQDGRWTELPLPSFRPGHESLSGPFNVYPRGAWLVLSYAGGLAAYSSEAALAGLAAASEDPVEAAVRLAQAGDLSGAIDRLESAAVGADTPRGREVARRLLAMCSERALDLATEGEREAALALLDRARARIDGGELLQRWHLSRVEVFRSLGDLDAVYREQDELYRVMSSSG